MSETQLALGLTSAAVAVTAFLKGYRRIGLSRAKHPSLTGHSRMAKAFAGLIPNYAYSEEKWLGIDGADTATQALRRGGFERLVDDLSAMSPETLKATRQITPHISDIQLTKRYRIPFQFRNQHLDRLAVGSVWRESHGAWLTDLDGQRFIDVSGCYGVNLFGLDFYKETIDQAVAQARPLGPFLGGYHPAINQVVEELIDISGMDEVSFHMSGTEAVMQAVRLARYHTGKQRLVRFCGAYHGWWDDVQPGPGNPMPPSRHTLTLREMHERTLQYLRTAKNIACVLVNPIQSMHPNRAAPTDSMLIDGMRSVHFDRAAYAAWLQELRRVCDERGIVFIMDEVFLGFRLAVGGAQEYFGVRADLVTYGKTLGGGLPVGVLCGKSQLMKRFKENRPAEVCFARGTFNAHPYVITAMQAFLQQIRRPENRQRYAELDSTWDSRRHTLNQLLAQNGLPLRFEGMPTIWALIFAQPGRFHWLFQFYLRREGIVMSWVGTGRLIFNLGFSADEFDAFCRRFVSAAKRFQEDGWMAVGSGQDAKQIRRQVFREILAKRFSAA